MGTENGGVVRSKRMEAGYPVPESGQTVPGFQRRWNLGRRALSVQGMEEEVLAATLTWGSTIVARTVVPTWDKVRIGDLFVVPDDLAARTIDFGPRPMLGEQKMVTWGSLTVVVEVGHAVARAPRSREGGGLAAAFAVAAAAHLFVLAGAHELPQDDETITADRIEEMRSYLSEEDDGAASARPDPPAAPSFAMAGRWSGGVAGARSPTRGAAPLALEPRSNGGDSRSRALAEASRFGLAEMLPADVGTSSMTRATSGGLFATDGLDDLGGGGLALSGVGEGSGGFGRGVDVDPAAGLGLAGAGPGASCDDDCRASRLGKLGIAGGQAQLRATHTTKPISFRCPPEDDGGCVSVLGHRLPAEAIQRVVRANFGRFRACYEAGLAKNPSLAGTVPVAFLVGRGGDVAAAKEGAGADLPDGDVRACIVRAFASLTFPDPGDATVSVTYRLVLAPE
jgi:hypothetical protein